MRANRWVIGLINKDNCENDTKVIGQMNIIYSILLLIE